MYLQPASEQSLAAEAVFAASHPYQDYVVHWWGWAPIDIPSVIEVTWAAPPKPGEQRAPLQQRYETYTTRFGPWLRLVGIRGAVALSILVAAVLPTMALWLFVALLATGTMPS